jgi:hypothetical protein
MAPRNTRPIECGNCPRPIQVSYPAAVMRTLAITSESESERLWKHVLYGTQTCIGMIEGYAELDLPGDPSGPIEAMRDRLDRLLERYAKP